MKKKTFKARHGKRTPRASDKKIVDAYPEQESGQRTRKIEDKRGPVDVELAPEGQEIEERR